MLMHLLNIWCFLWSADNRTRKWPAHFADLVQCSASIFPTDLCSSSPISASPPLGTFSKFTKARWSTKKKQKKTTLYFPQGSIQYLSFSLSCIPSLPLMHHCLHGHEKKIATFKEVSRKSSYIHLSFLNTVFFRDSYQSSTTPDHLQNVTYLSKLYNAL